MAKKGPVIGGYAVPGGRSGAAVTYACQLISQNPGIKQGDVHEQSARWAGLNFSTANWITSPGPKSPAEILWGRQKEGRGFRCYPNENTDKLGDPRPFLQAEILKEFDPCCGFSTTTETRRSESSSDSACSEELLLLEGLLDLVRVWMISATLVTETAVSCRWSWSENARSTGPSTCSSRSDHAPCQGRAGADPSVACA